MKKLVIFLLFAAPFVLNAQMTYVPDDNFEQALIDLGLDTSPLNDSVPTKNIDTISILDLPSKNIFDLTGIEDFKALTNLECWNNALTSLDVSKNTALTELVCSWNTLTSLDVSKNTALTYLDCMGNKLTSLDVSKNSVLTILSCDKNALTGLDVSMNSAMRELFCSENTIFNLNISKNSAFHSLSCRMNKLTNLDVSKNIALTWLYCDNNPDLYCIQVVDSAKAENNTNWRKDATAHYSTDCGYTGVEDFKFDNKDVSVAPNPASDFIEIELGNNHTLKGVVDDVKIYNFLGEIVSGLDTPPYPLFLEGGKCRIDVSGLVPGVYFIRLGDVVWKFVKI